MPLLLIPMSSRDTEIVEVFVNKLCDRNMWRILSGGGGAFSHVKNPSDVVLKIVRKATMTLILQN
jgi:hypothetical protein